ncbi:OLC1v1000939C1 [Oldenlandia corymbosa var. corymbosa]|uniref:OLC1v1000939C1 n=1 Tax=Oldenlandia corymbosa var. corymbosa TaxID=529605 RepID=A0AAV1D459_OLDCO|nr:OLC1v1000939C1 [Oldenlandia corymbosa var. corymbosa]
MPSSIVESPPSMASASPTLFEGSLTASSMVESLPSTAQPWSSPASSTLFEVSLMPSSMQSPSSPASSSSASPPCYGGSHTFVYRNFQSTTFTTQKTSKIRLFTKLCNPPSVLIPSFHVNIGKIKDELLGFQHVDQLLNDLEVKLQGNRIELGEACIELNLLVDGFNARGRVVIFYVNGHGEATSKSEDYLAISSQKACQHCSPQPLDMTNRRLLTLSCRLYAVLVA